MLTRNHVFDLKRGTIERVVRIAEEMRPDGGAVDGRFGGGQDDRVFHKCVHKWI